KEDHWEELKKRFSEFKKDKNINCYSIPVEASKGSKRTDLGETILNWWEYFEQKSLAQNIKYQYCMFTDIADCYPSIYTHSITWAMYGKEKVKNDENKCSGSLGDKIDKKISGMQHNQTNGIPQGSVLMDFVAEIVLGYVDLRLSKELKKLENLK
ncbi:RNA-directed DNA polymerase, partial [Enterococcus faecium]